MKQLKQLLERMDYICIQGDLNQEISDLVYDSRKITKNSLFVCIKGTVADGHTFAADAVKLGASVLVVSEPVDAPDAVTVIKTKDTRYALALLSAAYFDYPAKQLKVIGITGTKGKTTTAYMVKSILEGAGYKTGLIGTIETIIGEETIPSANTTPESYLIQSYFRKMADCSCECCVMEVSSQGLMMHRTAGFLFEIGIFTNIEPDHIGPNEHASFEEYLECKSRLFRQCRIGILNADDAHFRDLLKRHTCEVETFGFSEHADLRAENVKLLQKAGSLGVSYHISGKLDFDVEINVPGKFSVYNSLTAIAVCRHFGIGAGIMKQALRQAKTKGRIEMVKVSDRKSVV